jgi:adenylate cyclase
LVILSLGLFFASFLFAYILYKIVLHPFNELKYAMRQVTGGDFEYHLPVKGLTEVANLYDDFNIMIKFCRKKIALKHYVSDSTAKMVEVLKTGEITTQPSRKVITMLFTDVRGFTSYAEQHDPFDVVKTINDILAIQVEIIKKNLGDILKFVGDEIMAEFPDPSLAFKSAVEIQQKVAVFNKKREEPLHLGIGINYGEAVVGAIGSGNHYDWTTIGHTVNLARRLCSAAAPGEIYIAEAVFQQIRTRRKFEHTSIKVKGISKKVKAYFIKDKNLE